jgi:hypothetical protein
VKDDAPMACGRRAFVCAGTSLPPGFVIDASPTQASGLPPGFVIDQPVAAPQAPSPDVTIGGNGEPTRITVRPDAPQPTALQSFREAIDPANVMAAAGSAFGKNARSLRVVRKVLRPA